MRDRRDERSGDEASVQGAGVDGAAVYEGREPERELENADAREEQEQELRVLLERAVPRLPDPEGRLLRVRERVGRIRRRRRATGATALTVTGLVLAGTFLPGVLRGSGSESGPVLPAAPVPSNSSRAIEHDGPVQFRGVAGLILRLPEGWQALEMPGESAYDEVPEGLTPPEKSTAPSGGATRAPSGGATTVPSGGATRAPSGGATTVPSDAPAVPSGGVGPTAEVPATDSDITSRPTARGFASSQSLTANAQACAQRSGNTCLPVKELRRGAALLGLVPRTERGLSEKLKGPPVLYEAETPSKTCESIRGTREYNGMVAGAPAPFTAVAVNLCVSGDASWTVEAVRSMIAGADFDKAPVEDSGEDVGKDGHKGAESVSVPAAGRLRNKE